MNKKLVAERIISESDDNKYYWATTVCLNCGMGGKYAFLKYTLVNDNACPECECNRLTLSNIQQSGKTYAEIKEDN